MGVENLIGFQFGFWMREEKFLHQITVFTDIHGSFDSDVPRHTVVLVADVVAKVYPLRHPGKKLEHFENRDW